MGKKTILEEVLGQQENASWGELSFGEKTRRWQAALMKDGLSLDVRQWSPEEADARESAYYMVLLDVDGNIVSKHLDLSFEEGKPTIWAAVRHAHLTHMRAQEALKVIVALAAEQKLQEDETGF